ncbi:hypothetical protein HY642_04915 [Candidatus Woesearchaeota archaeon]|nr:hypothetical protein [Candidatus Woesearchaeota archaeon]
MYAVLHTAEYEKEAPKLLSPEEMRILEDFETRRLTLNAHLGDPLGVPFFREKKLDGKRIYFLVYEDLRAVLMVAVSSKKRQPHVIEQVKSAFAQYYAEVLDALRQRA